LLDSPERSDLSVVVGSHKFHAHQIILNLRTDFFATATKPEHGFTESIDNTVVIEEHSAHAVWRMLTYCYTGEYEVTKTKDTLGEGAYTIPTATFIHSANIHSAFSVKMIPVP
jgi:hypothetical protein